MTSLPADYAPTPTWRSRVVSLARRLPVDAALIALVSIAVFCLAMAGAKQIEPVAFDARNFDIYLQGDMPRTYVQMTSRLNDGARTGVHPLYLLVVYPPTAAVHALLRLSWLDAARCTVAAIAALWAAALFACARGLRLDRIDALLMTAVGISGASAIYWSVVPETFLLGGIALLITVLVVERSRRHELGDGWYIASGVATVATTLTNWSSGFLLALTTGDARRIIRITLQVFGALTLVWIVERLFFPQVQFIFDNLGVRQFVHLPGLGRLLDVSTVFFASTAVAPRVELCHSIATRATTFLTTFQAARIGSGGVLSLVATLVWLGLLCMGLIALLRRGEDARIRFLLGGTLLCQFLLHLVYGGETFLYSPHWWGMLVLVAALGLRTQKRWLARGLAIAFVVLAAPHNVRTWQTTLPAFRRDLSALTIIDRNCPAE